MKRPLLKAFTWRLAATIATVTLVYIATGHIKLSIGVGVAEFVLKFALYFLHEIAWGDVREQ